MEGRTGEESGRAADDIFPDLHGAKMGIREQVKDDFCQVGRNRFWLPIGLQIAISKPFWIHAS